jgi:ABC-type branched-subunit amino acid transport system substrate-binding protein
LHRAALCALLLVFLLGAAGTAQEGGEPAAAAPGSAAPPAPEAGLTLEEAAGRQIYRTGTSPSGEEILAILAGGTELPAAVLTCSSCHGEDGRGNPEGGVVPTDLTWEALTRPYGVRSRGGREHGPYTPSLLKRSIAMGLDPAGNELHVAMPRYRMSLADMAALVAYMRQLGGGGGAGDPGIGPDRLRVGTLLPPAGRMAGVGGAIEALLRAWAAELNESGGLYGRSVELVAFGLPTEPAEWATAAAGFLDREEVFALVAAYIAGAEAELGALLRERQVPLVGPFTQRPRIERPVNPQVFYLLPGLAVQGRVLVAFALERSRRPAGEAVGDRGAGAPPEPPVATVLHPEGDRGLAEVADALLDEGRRLGWSRLGSRTYPAGGIDAPALAAALAAAGSETVFFLGDGADRQLLLRAAERHGWRPEVYTPGAMAGPEALATPPAFDGRLYLSFPTLPDDRSPVAAESYRALAEEHELPGGHLATQLATLAAARLFEEGVKRAGRDLSRSKLVAELEKLYQWDSGLTPLLTFTPNRRVGAQGAYVVAVDLEGRTFRRVGGWVEVE